ncbi:hypothetical protein FISHEDRAFT_70585 [Fistulina hepatica ATCC 64428]|uniref:RING-type domain-containing protein n=1 Tax=Fistulina hepatica ATCC 64428 TaxID=1128425 RepID=A0A0D7AIB4_9AGAR|nr:hypothetical protein FISHEDRAFT_70585 [Fistulina hepatica ATCC 64428]
MSSPSVLVTLSTSVDARPANPSSNGDVSDYRPDMYNSHPDELNFVSEAVRNRKIDETIHSFPHLSPADVDLEDKCPVCLVVYEDVFEEERERRAVGEAADFKGKKPMKDPEQEVQPPSQPTGEYGVTELRQCGHRFCRNCLVEWVRTMHGVCPICRYRFLNVRPPYPHEHILMEGMLRPPENDDSSDEDYLSPSPSPPPPPPDYLDLETNIHDWDAFEEWLEAPDGHAMLTREQVREKHPGLVGDWTDKEVEVMLRMGLLKPGDQLPAVDPRFLPDNVTPESTALYIPADVSEDSYDEDDDKNEAEGEDDVNHGGVVYVDEDDIECMADDDGVVPMDADNESRVVYRYVYDDELRTYRLMASQIPSDTGVPSDAVDPDDAGYTSDNGDYRVPDDDDEEGYVSDDAECMSDITDYVSHGALREVEDDADMYDGDDEVHAYMDTFAAGSFPDDAYEELDDRGEGPSRCTVAYDDPCDGETGADDGIFIGGLDVPTDVPFDAGSNSHDFGEYDAGSSYALDGSATQVFDAGDDSSDDGFDPRELEYLGGDSDDE